MDEEGRQVAPAELGVNVFKCRDHVDLVGTMIHEYVHHLQDPERTDEKMYESEADAEANEHMEFFLDIWGAYD